MRDERGADNGEPHVVLIDGRLYGFGRTRAAALADFRKQVAGALPAMRASMADRARVIAITDEHASDVAEMLCAEAIAWSDVDPVDAQDVSDEVEDRRFINHYDCPCGTHWSNEDDCTCDDRCPDCRTSCSPTESEDA